VLSILYLVFMGAQVKSHHAGLSVPDWPLAFGSVWPIMTGGVFHEHWHRTIATGVGLLTIVVAVWTSRRESRRWVAKLAWWLLAAVVFQGLLGGLTVKQLLPPEVSATHAGMAQTVLCLAAWLAYACSSEWARLARAALPDAGAAEASLAPAQRAGATSSRDPRADAAHAHRGGSLRAARVAAVLAMFSVYVQLALGAWMRHTEAGLAVPFFPVDGAGRLLPEVIDQAVLVHMAHRAFAVLVLLAVLRAAQVAGRVASGLMLHAGALAATVLLQAGLGASVIWLKRPPELTSLHVANGALVLLLCWLLVLRLWRRERAATAGSAGRDLTAGIPGHATGERAAGPA